MRSLKVKHIFILLLLKTFCLSYSISNETNNANRHKRRIEGTTTAEPKIGWHNSTINTNVTQTLSSTTTATTVTKTTEKRDMMSAYTGSTTTERFNNLQYTRLSTLNMRHTTSTGTTTTAMPVAAQSIPIVQQRQFDVLSFIGGCLFTFCLVGIGVVLWKIYVVHVERSYRTI